MDVTKLSKTEKSEVLARLSGWKVKKEYGVVYITFPDGGFTRVFENEHQHMTMYDAKRMDLLAMAIESINSLGLFSVEGWMNLNFNPDCWHESMCGLADAFIRVGADEAYIT